ncbi:SPOR domain-containing protein [Kitasatospora sp. NPDC057223]|uniref:SPOR domain-containing protein n=1 Tax=Kitasatospora sp. NPDC057223 TaxID=3346055 RepID=UPI0036364198
MGTPEYRVMRQDDNGNRYLVAGGLAEAQAEQLAAEFEARGHKQLYWVEREAGSGGAARGQRE